MRGSSWVPLDLFIVLLQVQGDYNKSYSSCACEIETFLIVYFKFVMIFNSLLRLKFTGIRCASRMWDCCSYYSWVCVHQCGFCHCYSLIWGITNHKNLHRGDMFLSAPSPVSSLARVVLRGTLSWNTMCDLMSSQYPQICCSLSHGDFLKC